MGARTSRRSGRDIREIAQGAVGPRGAVGARRARQGNYRERAAKRELLEAGGCMTKDARSRTWSSLSVHL